MSAPGAAVAPEESLVVGALPGSGTTTTKGGAPWTFSQSCSIRRISPRAGIAASWTPAHGWLHILSDLGVWTAYLAIPCVLGFFALRRRDIPFRGIFWLFGAFILACGTTHLMEAIIFWWPAYRLAGLIKLFTAIVSWATVIALVPDRAPGAGDAQLGRAGAGDRRAQAG